MASLAFDLRDAVRGLRRDLGYALTVVLTLSLTIGAATAVFSIVDGVLLKPLAYRESQRLVSLREIWRQFAERASGVEVNERHFEYWRQHTRTFESMAQYIVLPANLTGLGDAAQIAVGRVSGSIFDVLQVQPALGRTLMPADEPSASPEVAVITDACWRQRLGSDPRVVGRILTLDGQPHTIVGVLRPDFQLPTVRLASVADAFVPIHVDAERVGWGGDHNNEAIGRLRAGVTPERARAELDVLQAQVSEIATRETHETVTLASVVTPLTETIVGQSRRGLWLLLGAIAMVLLIACSNLANLSLTRAVGRLRDAGIRSALGASRARLAMRAAIEQLVLSSAGGALGLAVAWTSLQLFVRTAPIELPRVNEVAIDGRVLAFSAAVSILAGAAVAVLPAWRAARRDIEGTLRAGALTTTGDRAGIRVRAVLLASQIALSLTLLVVTGLLAASFVRLMSVDRGFVAERALLVPLSMPGNRYDTERVRQDAYARLIAAMEALPGVSSATTTSAAPLSGSTQVNGVAPDGSRLPRSQQPSANYRFVGPEFFRTLGIAVQRGRPFTNADRGEGRAMPALISDRTAQRLWPGQDALGKHFSRGIPGEAGFEVVGIVGDARITALDRTPPLMVYLPYWWRTRAALSLLLRTATESSSLMPSVRRAIHAIDPEIAVGDARSLEQIVDTSVAGRRYQMRLFAVFGVVALFIATLGVYAVTAYAVSQRRREMNIRVALGARSRQVMAMVMAQGLAPIAAGVAAGVVFAVAIGGVVASLLFDVQPHDPAVIAPVAAIMAGTAVVACFVAALRGLRINPAAALRQE
jgi:predicted permease